MADIRSLTPTSQALFAAFGFKDQNGNNIIEAAVFGEGYYNCKECDQNGDKKITTDEAWAQYYNNISSHPHITRSLKAHSDFRDPFEASKEIMDYVNKYIMPLRQMKYPSDRLIAQMIFINILSKEKMGLSGIEVAPLHIEFDMDPLKRLSGTLTAADVFKGQNGKRFALCLEYSYLFVAMARLAGLDTSLAEIPTNIKKTGGNHICALVRPRPSPADVLYGPPKNTLLIDLTAFKFDSSNKKAEELCDAEALSQFYVNFEWSMLKNNRPEEGKRALLTAIEIYPDVRLAHAMLGGVYHQEGNIGPAIYEYKRSTEIDTNFCGPQHRLTSLYWDRKEYGKAIGSWFSDIVCSVRNW